MQFRPITCYQITGKTQHFWQTLGRVEKRRHQRLSLLTTERDVVTLLVSAWGRLIGWQTLEQWNYEWWSKCFCFMRFLIDPLLYANFFFFSVFHIAAQLTVNSLQGNQWCNIYSSMCLSTILRYFTGIFPYFTMIFLLFDTYTPLKFRDNSSNFTTLIALQIHINMNI